MQKNLLLVIGVLVLIGGGYLVYTDTPKIAVTNNADDLAAAINYTARDGEMAVQGALDCLPHKSGKPVSQGECVMGLKGDDGKIYSLDTTKMETARGENLSKVKVVGTFVPANESSEEAGDYKYDGVMTVRAMEAI